MYIVSEYRYGMGLVVVAPWILDKLKLVTVLFRKTAKSGPVASRSQGYSRRVVRLANSGHCVLCWWYGQAQTQDARCHHDVCVDYTHELRRGWRAGAAGGSWAGAWAWIGENRWKGHGIGGMIVCAFCNAACFLLFSVRDADYSFRLGVTRAALSFLIPVLLWRWVNQKYNVHNADAVQKAVALLLTASAKAK